MSVESAPAVFHTNVCRKAAGGRFHIEEKSGMKLCLHSAFCTFLIILFRMYLISPRLRSYNILRTFH